MDMIDKPVAALIAAIAADIDTACHRTTVQSRGTARSWIVSRCMVAFVRNCGIAIVISVFFAAAHGPSHYPTDTGRLACWGQQHLVVDAAGRDDRGGSRWPTSWSC